MINIYRDVNVTRNILHNITVFSIRLESISYVLTNYKYRELLKIKLVHENLNTIVSYILEKKNSDSTVKFNVI